MDRGDCAKFRAMLADYVDGELSPINRVQFEEQHKDCPACAQRLKEISALSQRLREVFINFAPPPELLDEIRAGLPDPKRLLEVPLFGQIAKALGYIDDDALKAALDEQSEMRMAGNDEQIGAILIRHGKMTEQQAMDTLKVQGEQGSPETIGGFEILEQVGRGGMGVVYRANQVSLDRIVAVKILYPRLAVNRKFVESFLTEAHSVAQLSHPNIITGIDAGEQDSFIYLAMEFVDGLTLRQMLKKQGKLSEAQTIDVAIQAASALEYARKQQFIHRDIKPDNIMIDKSGIAKVCDLGLAKRGEQDILAKEGEVLGTPHYLSPEQALGRSDLDTRTDIYSLGATIYHALTGTTPYSGASAQEIMQKHVRGELKPPREIAAEISEGMEAIILKMMAKERDLRYATPADLQRDLELLKAGKRPAALTEKLIKEGKLDPKELLRRKRSPVATFAAVLFVVLVIGSIIWASKSNRKLPVAPSPTFAALSAKPSETSTPTHTKSFDPRVLELALESLNKIVRESPDDYEKILAAASELRTSYPGTPQALTASNIISKTREKLNAAARKTLEDMTQRARTEIAKGDFNAALAVFADVPESVKISSEYTKLPERIAALNKEIEEAFNKALKNAHALIEAKKFIEAEDALASLIRLSPVEKAGAVRALFNLCDTAREKYVTSESKQALAAILDLTLSGDIEAAKQKRSKFIADPLFEEYKSEFEATSSIISPIERVVRTFNERMTELVGKRVSMRLAEEFDERSFKINEIKPDGSLDVMEYSSGMPKRLLKLIQLHPLTVTKYAKERMLRATTPREKGAAMQDSAIYLFFCGQFYDADMDAKAANAFGFSITDYAAVQAQYKSLILDRFAVKALADFDKMPDTDPNAVLQVAERILREYANSVIIAQKRETIEKRMSSAKLRLSGILSMFKGKIEMVDSRHYKFIYDFSDVAQMEDFSFDPKFWKIEKGELTVSEDPLYNHPLHHTALFTGPVEVVLEYRNDRPNSVCARVGGVWHGINSHNGSAGFAEFFDPEKKWDIFKVKNTGYAFPRTPLFTRVSFFTGDSFARMTIDGIELMTEERKAQTANIEIRDLGFAHFKRIEFIGELDAEWLAEVTDVMKNLREKKIQKGLNLHAYTDIYFSRLAESKVVSTIDSEFSTPPSAKIKGNTWSVKYEGYIMIAQDGEYDISISTTARLRFRIDGSSLADNLMTRDDPVHQISLKVSLKKGLRKFELILVNEEKGFQHLKMNISYGTGILSPVAPIMLFSDLL